MGGDRDLAESVGMTQDADAGAARAGSRWFLLVVAAFIAALLTSNIIAVRIVTLGDAPIFGELLVTSAIVVFPLSYIVGDMC